jgi:hypothetical protein
MAKAKHAVPEGLYTDTPHLTIDNAAKAIDWVKSARGRDCDVPRVRHHGTNRPRQR